MGERLGSESGSQVGARPCGRLHRTQDLVVVVRIGDHGDPRLILCRAPHHGGTADVDVFDRFIVGRTPSHGLLERIQIDAHQIDRLAADAAEGIAVGIGVTHEHSSVHSRMKRLHASIHHLGKAGVVRDVRYLETRFP